MARSWFNDISLSKIYLPSSSPCPRSRCPIEACDKHRLSVLQALFLKLLVANANCNGAFYIVPARLYEQRNRLSSLLRDIAAMEQIRTISYICHAENMKFAAPEFSRIPGCALPRASSRSPKWNFFLSTQMVVECTSVQTGSGHMALLLRLQDNAVNKQADSGLHQCSIVANCSLSKNCVQILLNQFW